MLSSLFQHQCHNRCHHYNGVIMGAIASQITSLMIVYSTVYSNIDKNIKAPRHWLLCGEFTGRWPVNSPHKWPVTRKMFPLTTSSCFSVTPATESVHIGVSDNKYNSVDESARAEMAQCLILKAMIPLDFDLNQVCAMWIHGRYIYISLIRGSIVLGNIGLCEVRVYMSSVTKHIYTKHSKKHTQI